MNNKSPETISGLILFPKVRSDCPMQPLPDSEISLQGTVCHEATVGSSAESSTASVFSTAPVVYL